MVQKKKIFCKAGLCASVVIFLIATLVAAVSLFNDYKKERLFYIESVEIMYNSNTIEFIKIDFQSTEHIEFEIIINGDREINTKKFNMPQIVWVFAGNDLGNTISDGVVNLTNTHLGVMKVQVEVSSKNTVSASVVVEISPKCGSVLSGMKIDSPPNNTIHEEGAPFNCEGMIVSATFYHADGEYSVRVDNFTVEPGGHLTTELLNGATYVLISYSHDGVVMTLPVDIILTRTLQSISVIPPTIILYKEGQKLNTTGLKVFANYTYIQRELDSTEYVIDFDFLTEYLTPENNSIRIIHLNSGLYLFFDIFVTPRTLLSIAVFGYETNYIRHQRFNANSLTVIANYDYVASRQVFGFNVSNLNMLGLSDDGSEIVISYIENEVTVEYRIIVTVRLPYDPLNIRLITIVGDSDNVELTWIFSYPGDDYEEEIIDYQTHIEQGLLFDTVNGVFEVPAQAIVSIRKINPMITDFFVNGVRQNLDFESENFTFVVGGEDIDIMYEKIDGERVTLRFEGEVNTLMFYFSINWTGRILQSHINQINFIFYETAMYMYQFWFEGEQIYIEDFATYQPKTFYDTYGNPFIINFYFLRLGAFDGLDGIVVEVKRVERSPSETRKLTLIFWEDFEMEVNIVYVSGEDWYDQVLIPHRDEYIFVMWVSVSENVYEAYWQKVG